jgi:hypothetical protein
MKVISEECSINDIEKNITKTIEYYLQKSKKIEVISITPLTISNSTLTPNKVLSVKIFYKIEDY